MHRKSWIPGVAGLVFVSAAAFCLHPASGVVAQTANKPGLNIDPTALVHPSAILEGNITIGPYSTIGAGSILTGNITIGHHTGIACNVTIRGRNRIGNYTQIYDNVNLEGGRGAGVGTNGNVADQSIVGDGCWINHGAVMHGTQLGDGGVIGLGAACDYNTRIGKGAILANGSSTHVDQVIPDNCFAEGVPAVIKQKDITDKDRLAYLGLLPARRTRFFGDAQEAAAKKRMAAR